MHIFRTSLFAVICLSFVGSIQANVGIFLSSASFKALDDISLIADNALFQLINLGIDGLANQVVEDSWVGGDDVLIDLAFGSSEFASSGAFDLWEADGNPGELFRLFDFAITPGVLQEGDLIALRWWPGYTADAFHSTPFTPVIGDRYGEARLAVPLNDPTNNTSWVVPAESSPLVILDPLISPEVATANSLIATPDFSGVAEATVAPVPELKVTGCLFGLAALSIAGARRSSHRKCLI